MNLSRFPLIVLAVLSILAPARVLADGARFFRPARFIRADANGDGRVDISDPVRVLLRLFTGDATLPCLNAANSNGDLAIDISDAVFTLAFLFRDAPPPPAPGLSCGTDPADFSLSCESYPLCTDDDLPLIRHVLNRITFGPTPELLARIHHRDDLVGYILEQLDGPPDGFDQSVDEPELAAIIESLGVGFNAEMTPGRQDDRLKGVLLVDALRSRWQLLHVVARFWNNHFHTQIDTSRQYFARGGRGGPAINSTRAMFAAADTNDSNGITEDEWIAFRATHPAAIAWSEFGNARNDGVLTEAEFLNRRTVGYWKYRGGNQQLGAAADLERREYDLYRRMAFGRFRDLLEASSKSPAMLIYLNGFENTVAEPNENFAREYFELFGLGVDHSYTQRDIEELARVFTGWTVAWVRRANFDPTDTNFTGAPGANRFSINDREPNPFRFPTMENWENELYTWGFVFGNPSRNAGHDWGRKDLFLPRYGGVDSMGNPLTTSDEVRIARNDGNRSAQAAMAEFDLILDRTVALRDCGKFISTKLIQLFVTDDLSKLQKTGEMSDELRAAFDSIDTDGSRTISRQEWEEPIPLVLPNGRPPEVFDHLDTNASGRITETEYHEPDLLAGCIDSWRATGGRIRAVLRTILLSDEFLSMKFADAKVKDPFELVAGAVRALDGGWTQAELLNTADDLALAGMELFDFGDPTGESELGFDWMHTSGLLQRIQYVNRGANPATAGEQRFTWSPAGAQARWDLDSAERTVDYFDLLLFGGTLSDAHRELAMRAWESASGSRRVRATAAYMLSLPGNQKQ